MSGIGKETGLVTTPGPDDSAADSYDPMRQFAELAGDVRDPYPMFAGIRADTPVMEVHFGAGPDGRYHHDERAPLITSLFTVTSHELAQQVLTDNVRFSSSASAMTTGQVMGRTILGMDPPEHQRHRPGRQGLPRSRPGPVE
jgi:cytochrome P450